MLEFPASKVKFRFKMDTDYLELAKNKVVALSATISHSGEYMGLYCRDRVVRIYNFRTGKLFRSFEETLEVTKLGESIW